MAQWQVKWHAKQNASLAVSTFENISKKIACAIGAIKRIRHRTPFNVLIKFIIALFNHILIIAM